MADEAAESSPTRNRRSRLEQFLIGVYERYGPLNARQYCYRAETAGEINTSRGKKKPFDYINAILVKLRESGRLPWSAVLDSSRDFSPWRVVGSEDVEWLVGRAVEELRGLPQKFELPPWQYQPIVPVIFTEKEGLVPYFEMMTRTRGVSIYAHKGQAGLSHLHEVIVPWLARQIAKGKNIRILYLGDVDDEGYQIPVNLLNRIADWMGGSPRFNLRDLWPKGGDKIHHDESVIEFVRVALKPEQVEEYGLSKLEVNPRSAIAHKFVDYKCELEALDPDVLRGMINHAIDECWNPEAERRREKRQDELRGEIGHMVGELTKGWR